MPEKRALVSRRRMGAWLLFIAVAVTGGLAFGMYVSWPAAAPPELPPPPPAEVAREATTEEVHRLCGTCHAYPPPDTFPRFAWRMEVKQAYDFFHEDPSLRFEYPPLDAVVRYYESRAPVSLA